MGQTFVHHNPRVAPNWDGPGLSTSQPARCTKSQQPPPPPPHCRRRAARDAWTDVNGPPFSTCPSEPRCMCATVIHTVGTDKHTSFSIRVRRLFPQQVSFTTTMHVCDNGTATVSTRPFPHMYNGYPLSKCPSQPQCTRATMEPHRSTRVLFHTCVTVIPSVGILQNLDARGAQLHGGRRRQVPWGRGAVHEKGKRGCTDRRRFPIWVSGAHTALHKERKRLITLADHLSYCCANYVGRTLGQTGSLSVALPSGQKSR